MQKDYRTQRCESCGSEMAAGAQYCIACGAPVSEKPPEVRIPQTPAQAAPPQSAFTAAPSYTSPPPVSSSPAAYSPVDVPSYPDAPVTKKRTGLWIALGALGCLGLCCIATVIGVMVFQPAQIFSDIQDTIGEEVPGWMLETPVPFEEGDSNLPSVGQYSDGDSFMDDFSSDQFGWYVAGTGDSVYSYESGGYAINVIPSGLQVWSEVPVDYPLGTIQFDAQILVNRENGFYGLMCNFQDGDNFTYIAFDVDFGDYQVYRLIDDSWFNQQEEEWVVAESLNSDPGAWNQYSITCTPESVTIVINGNFEAQVMLDATVEPGGMALFAETWDDMPGNYKVLFDNVVTYRSTD